MEVELTPPNPALERCRERFGFVPNLFLAQQHVPHLIDAEIELAEAALFSPSTVPVRVKEWIFAAVAATRNDPYWRQLLVEVMQLSGTPEPKAVAIATDFREAGLSAKVRAYLDYAAGLITSGDQELSADEKLDTALAAAAAHFLVTLAAHIRPSPDFTMELAAPAMIGEPNDSNFDGHPWDLAAPADGPEFDAISAHYGFLPNLDRTLAQRPRVAFALGRAVQSILGRDGKLTRLEKELIMLRIALDHGDEYSAALEDRVLREQLSVSPDVVDEWVSTAGESPWRPEDACPESAAVMALASFRFTLARASRMIPELPWRHATSTREKTARILHPGRAESRPFIREADPDAALVAAARQGDDRAFEQLVQIHGRRIHRTLVGILGDPEEAKDAVQDTFLKAYRALPGFESRAKFGTWLLTVAANTGIERLRSHRPTESIDEGGPFGGEEPFRPRQFRAWDDTPEQRFAREEMRAILEREVRMLPAKYRMVIVLRDLEQVPAEDAARALGLSIPAIKARLLRARMMLREALSVHLAAEVRS